VVLRDVISIQFDALRGERECVERRNNTEVLGSCSCWRRNDCLLQRDARVGAACIPNRRPPEVRMASVFRASNLIGDIPGSNRANS